MQIKKCDLCKQELSQFDRIYFVKYGEKSMNPISKNTKQGELCQSCCKKIDSFIQEMKK